jgi:hypothetical protein
MKKSLVVIAILTTAIRFETIALRAQTSKDGASGQRALTGVVSDAMCGRTHMMKDRSEADCLRYCVQHGGKYALIVGQEVYTLEGHRAELDRYAAKAVTVSGRVKGKTVAVDSVVPAKSGGQR